MRSVIMITKLISHGGSLKLDELSSTRASRFVIGEKFQNKTVRHFGTGEITIARGTLSSRVRGKEGPRPAGCRGENRFPARLLHERRRLPNFPTD